jgi:hypothetical protein
MDRPLLEEQPTSAVADRKRWETPRVILSQLEDTLSGNVSIFHETFDPEGIS